MPRSETAVPVSFGTLKRVNFCAIRHFHDDDIVCMAARARAYGGDGVPISPKIGLTTVVIHGRGQGSTYARVSVCAATCGVF